LDSGLGLGGLGANFDGNLLIVKFRHLAFCLDLLEVEGPGKNLVHNLFILKSSPKILKILQKPIENLEIPQISTLSQSQALKQKKYNSRKICSQHMLYQKEKC
jgi:hypothetical protein